MNKSTSKPYPFGRTEVLPPLEPHVSDGLVRGYNPTLANTVAIAERGKAVKDEGISRKLLKRTGALAVTTLVAVGLVHGSGGGESTPKLDTPYTATGNETPSGIAKDVVGNSEWRNLNDELVKDSSRDGEPGYQPGEAVNVPHKFVEDHQKQEQPRQ